jgi:hypothetical protein
MCMTPWLTLRTSSFEGCVQQGAHCVDGWSHRAQPVSAAMAGNKVFAWRPCFWVRKVKSSALYIREGCECLSE